MGQSMNEFFAKNKVFYKAHKILQLDRRESVQNLLKFALF